MRGLARWPLSAAHGALAASVSGKMPTCAMSSRIVHDKYVAPAIKCVALSIKYVASLMN